MITSTSRVAYSRVANSHGVRTMYRKPSLMSMNMRGDRMPVLVVEFAPDGRGAQPGEHDDGQQLRDADDDERHRRRVDGDRDAREQRAERLHDCGAQHPLDAVRGEQLVGGQDRRQQRRVGRVEESVGDAEHETDDRELPDLDHAGEREHRRRRDEHGLRRLDREQDALLRNAVGDRAADQHREQQADGVGGRDVGEVDRPAAELFHLEHGRDEPDTGPEQRQQEGADEDAVLPDEEGSRGARHSHLMLRSCEQSPHSHESPTAQLA